MTTHVGIFDEAEVLAKKNKQIKFLQAKCRKAGKDIKKLTKRAQEAEGELIIIKGIGNTSPEMKALQAREKELMEINKEHQQMNGKLNSTLEIERKNNTLLREDLQAKDLEIGRMMKKLTLKDS